MLLATAFASCETSAGFVNIPYTLFCPLGAIAMFENCASGSRFPALMLSRTLCKYLLVNHSPSGDGSLYRENGVARLHVPFNSNVLDPTSTNSFNLLLNLTSSQSTSSSWTTTASVWPSEDNMSNTSSS